ncbi:MAG: protein-L-isoaspartate(D-aspartate) O-methyltransferase [Spirochaetes bacterium]|nr:protein-L-isoaspartate(D-aspartate) O-methyltransferase [Spirochaetota bacterium]
MKRIVLTFLLFAFLFLSINSTDQFQKERHSMVKYQIENRGIRDKKVLDAMKTIKRHLFVPDELKYYAYDDRPLPIGYGQTISQPYIVALMTELLNVNKESSVLEIGTGSGYQAAILSEIVKEVYTVEIIKELSIKAEEKFKTLKLNNIHSLHADGYYGWEEKSPFDAVIVTCAAGFVPPPLIKQLKIGGVMAIPVGQPFRVQNLFLIKKISEEKIETEVVTEVIFVPLVRNESK